MTEFESVTLYSNAWWYYDAQREEIVYAYNSPYLDNRATIEAYIEECKNGNWKRFGPSADCLTIEHVKRYQDTSCVVIFDEGPYGDYLMFDARMEIVPASNEK